MPAYAVQPIDAPEDWKTLPVHTLADVTTFGQGIDVKLLAQKMRQFGYDESEPVVLIVLGGATYIFDGRHRRDAAIRAGVEPTFVLYTGDNPREFIFKKQLRQHLTVTQRAILASVLRTVKEPSERQNTPKTQGDSEFPSRDGNSSHPERAKTGRPADGEMSAKEAAQRSKVSEMSVLRVDKIRVSGIPQLQHALHMEWVGIKEASILAELDRDAQKDALKRFYCPRCLRTGALGKDCGSCERTRRGKKKQLPEPDQAPARGEPRYDHKTFRDHLGKALAEINKLARESGHVKPNGATDEPDEMGTIRRCLDDALKVCEAWRKKLAKASH